MPKSPKARGSTQEFRTKNLTVIKEGFHLKDPLWASSPQPQDGDDGILGSSQSSLNPNLMTVCAVMSSPALSPQTKHTDI